MLALDEIFAEDDGDKSLAASCVVPPAAGLFAALSHHSIF